MVFEALVNAIPSVSGLSGRHRCRPVKLYADKGYDFAPCRQHLHKRDIIARLADFGKLRIRFERSLQIHRDFSLFYYHLIALVTGLCS